MKTIILITVTLVSLTSFAQKKQKDIQKNDSISQMREMVYKKYGNNELGKKSQSAETEQSVVVRRPDSNMVVNPHAHNIKMPSMGKTQDPLFSRKDEQMWSRDYNVGTFVSDILIGK